MSLKPPSQSQRNRLQLKEGTELKIFVENFFYILKKKKKKKQNKLGLENVQLHFNGKAIENY